MHNMTFRKAIHQAIKESDLTISQRIKLNIVLLIPGSKNKIEQHILNKAVENNVVLNTLSLDIEPQVEID